MASVASPGAERRDAAQGWAAQPLILAASGILARELRVDASLARRAQGLDVWEAPRIRSLNQWLFETWAGRWPVEQLLDPAQELALWLDLVSADAGDVLSPTALARQARHAAQVCLRHGIRPDARHAASDEQHAFAGWFERFLRRLAEQRWMVWEQLAPAVAAALRSGAVAVPEAVELHGFAGSLPAAQQGVFDAMHARGVRIARAAVAGPATPQRLRCADAAAQYAFVASRIAAILRPFAESDRPPPRIVIACPHLERAREPLEAALRAHLAPWLDWPAAGVKPVPWRFSHGRPLAEEPVIAAALAVASLKPRGNDLDDVSRVLLASALWTPQERAHCAAADERLRERGGRRVALSELTSQSGPGWNTLRETAMHATRAQLPSAWAAHFAQRLSALGWPGSRPLDSRAFQARGEWQRALARFASMDRLLGRIAHADAARWLREIAAQHAFEPRADTVQPVLIAAPEECAGLTADWLFALDLSDDVLPPPVVRLPLIARALLAQAGVPAVTPEDALAQGRRLTQALLTMAPRVVLCAPHVDARGAECRPSPLFGPEHEWNDAPESPPDACARFAASGPHTKTPADDPVPKVTDACAEGIRGTVALFQAYAQAPFFALCEARLGIYPLAEPSAGLDGLRQGIAIHAVLRRVWDRLRTGARLHEASEDALAALIEEAVDAELPGRMPAAYYGHALVRLERARIGDLVRQWLLHERRRVDPFETLALEQKTEANVAGLELHLRLDRVDRVKTPWGPRVLVVDYKTGRNVDVGGWRTESLFEPQLPLYASSEAVNAIGVRRADGICFAHVRDGRPAFLAATNWRGRLIEDKRGGYRDDWDEQLAAWRERLEAMARGFLEGDARIDLSALDARGPRAPLLDLVR